MKIIFNDWRTLALVIGGFLLLTLILTGKGAEVLQFALDAIRAFRQ